MRKVVLAYRSRGHSLWLTLLFWAYEEATFHDKFVWQRKTATFIYEKDKKAKTE